MDAISFRCKSCKHLMKFPGDKAGKKAKCPKCGTLAVIPEDQGVPQKKAARAAAPVVAAPREEDAEEIIDLADEEAAPMVKAEEPAVPAPAAPTKPAEEEEETIRLVDDPTPKAVEEPGKPKFDEFANDGPDEYGVFVDPELLERQRILKEEEAAQGKKKKERKKLPKVTRKVKAIEQADDWAKVRIGLFCLFVGTCIWMFTHALQGLYVILGSVELSEYASLIATNLEARPDKELPKPGQFWNIDEFSIYMEIIAGRNFVRLAKTCVTISAVLYLFQALAWGAGYAMCLTVPRRFGMFTQVVSMMGLLICNGLVMLAFKLLPVVGIYNYIMVSFVAPEIAMTEYNMERMVPINILWSGAPFWENLFTLIFKFLIYLEPTFACIFVWSIGMAVKDPELASNGKSMSQMSLGTFFVLVAFHLLSLCGSSPILVIVLRVAYFMWFCGLLMFILQFALLLLRARAVIETKIHPANEATD